MLHSRTGHHIVWFEVEGEGLSHSPCHVPCTLAEIPRGHQVSPHIAHGRLRGSIAVNGCDCIFSEGVNDGV